MADTTEFLSSAEVAGMLGVSMRTVVRLVDRGDLRAHRVGRQLRYDPADVRAYLEQTIVKPGGK